MVMVIHKTAIVADGAQIHPEAEVGPYAVIGPNVKIGAGTKIGAHAIIDGHTTIGENCHIFAGASVGLEPQDLRYKNEPTGVIIGNNTTIREYVTIHRAVTEGFTTIGNDCFLMNYCHVAHNSQIGNSVIMANNTQMAGHVFIDDYAVLSGFCIMHQFTRIGKFVMIGGMTGTRVDLPPFTICEGRPAAVRGINVIGLRRGKIGAEVRAAIKQTYKLIYRAGLNVSQALTRIEEEVAPYPEIKYISEFFRTSKRGVAVAFGENEDPGVMEEVPVETI